MVNAAIFSLALYGFAAITAAQPHAKPILHRHHHRDRGISVEDFPTSDTPSNTNSGAKSDHTPESTTSSKDKPLKVFDYASNSSPVADESPSDISPLSTSEKQGKSGSDVDQDFPDGDLDCGTFPSKYGAVPLDWVTKDGWSGIQIDGGNQDKDSVCTEGALCSYACPPGYSKAQWPSDQPASGESHGGLKCKNGKLFKTRKFPKLCEAGTKSASVINKLNKFVAICRTDYPGSENMVVPLSCSPGTTQTLTVPEADSSYNWKGSPSSAQYYVNNAGVSLEDGCIWGKPNKGKGNWAPVVIGAGFRDNKAWLSISQNNLNSDPLNYNIKIVAAENSVINGECRYEDGKLHGEVTGNGCTVALDSGSAHYVLY